MFSRKKKEKKESSTSGDSSSYSQTTVHQSPNSTTITRQISEGSTRIQHTAYSREERSFSVSHSSSLGNFPSLNYNERPQSLVSNDIQLLRVFGSKSNDRLPAIRRDASPFEMEFGSSTAAASGNRAVTSGAPRASLNFPTTMSSSSNPTMMIGGGSFPARLRQPALPTFASQNSARNPIISSSVPATNDLIPTYLHKSAKLGAERTPYTKNEKLLLASLVEKHKNVIENKRTDASTIQEKQQKSEKLAAEYNA